MFKNLKFSIRTVLLAGFGGLLFASLGVTLVLGFSTATKNTVALLSQSLKGQVDQTAQIITDEVKKYEYQSHWLSEAFARGQITLDNTSELEAFIVGSFAATEDIAGIGIVDQQGRLFEMSRNFPTLAISRPPQYELDYFNTDAQLSGQMGGFWDAPIWLPETQQTIANYRNVVNLPEGGRILIAQGVTIQSLSNRLLEIKDRYQATPYVLYDGKYVLAHPNLTRSNFRPSFENPLPRLDQVNDPVLAALHRAEDVDWFEKETNNAVDSAILDINDSQMIIISRATEGLMDKPITFGIHLDDDTSAEEWDRLVFTGQVAAGFALLSMIVLFMMSRRFVRPIRDLAEASILIGENKLEQPIHLNASTVLEYDQAAKAFNGMVDGLREREKIRGLFGKIVPERVAEAMLSSSGALSPQNAEGTVLFCDLEGFTSLSEKLEPETIIDVLNSYFTDMVEIIEFHGGIITQFQGDAILAVFNVPIHDPEHAANAILAANAMLSRVQTKRYLGHNLRCRIGINTGPMIAGNVGAESRMNYTVHGDAVNTAARLENMNKQYGLHLLVAETTQQLAPNFSYKLVDEATIRGKEKPVKLYTIEE